MKSSCLFRSAVAALTAVGLMLPPPAVQAAGAAPRKMVVQTTKASVIDIGLQSDGAFAGRVVDHTGTPAANAEVVVRQGQKEVARVQTDESGRFVVPGLKSGQYEVASGKTVGAFRVWQDAAAPPAAKEQALLVLGQNGERGQFGGMGGGVLLLSTVVVASLIVGIVALDKINDVEDEVSQIPKS